MAYIAAQYMQNLQDYSWSSSKNERISVWEEEMDALGDRTQKCQIWRTSFFGNHHICGISLANESGTRVGNSHKSYAYSLFFSDKPGRI